ncbi:gamma-glutamylcyclotransferase family protein [Oceanobacillus saliphilus]|uniref:gamma-glutamylcyclotransferase family protein n=1 Tax=Oceanobacillus saliphilus TaxID=2925834 RepID=UPI00201D4DF8|nr:gamma-glutamylcyclotransferase family protein [Oceanobacillus saliphilus]
MNRVFVYGTLRTNEGNHKYLEGAKCLRGQAWIYGELFDTNKGYPVMKESNTEKVCGELFEVTDRQLAAIDRLEGYRGEASDNLYERKRVTVFDDSGSVMEAFTYVAGKSQDGSTDVIPFGDWKVYRYLRQGEIYYFAYGSCMDNRRFKLAKVDHYFCNNIGSGKLAEYGFRFSRSTKDGGKADIIVSSDEHVEGVIYRVPMEAVDYLYEREGVYVQAYRPLIVSVSTNEGKVIDALTFMGVTKSDETKPTVIYAGEILTGAKKFLSTSYIEGLQKKIDLLM